MRKRAALASVPVRPEVVDFLDLAIDGAERHGRESDPDHEVGDLQQLARLMWAQLSPAGRRAVADAWEPWGLEKPDAT